ncbi:MAG: efflux RND transporter permease subunit [Acidobacteriota bacterium]|nr:efflux RND transporter permease subunit [Acidobacteriota bacterium]
MSLAEFSVRRPVAILTISVAITLFGSLAFNQLPLELLPDLSYPTLTVQTGYADAAPTSVEQFVSRPLEETVGVIPGLRSLRSVSRAGISEVILEFEWDEEMDFAAMDAREKVNLVELPREADRPRVLRFDPTLDPIVRLAFHGDRPLDEVRQIADRWLKPRLESIPGVAAAKVRGGLAPEIQVDVDTARLAALGLTLDELATALRADNVNRPGGVLKDWGSVYLVRTLNEFEDLDQLRKTIVRDGEGGRVRVEDVAVVHRGHKDRVEITRASGEEIVEISLHKEGSSNTIVVSDEIQERLASIQAELAEGLELRILTDQSIYVRDALAQVKSAALFGGLLAILVLYFFLRDAISTLIVGITIPLSVVATFLPMLKTGVSLNIMSLGGLALGVGMLVDNSIVVLESIDRHHGQGKSRRESAIDGARQVTGAVIAATLTTISVFLPIVFVQGIAGQLFYDLAVTVCLSLLASLVVSLTLIPALYAVLASLMETLRVEGRQGGRWPWPAWPGWPAPSPHLSRRLARPFLFLGVTVIRLLLAILRPVVAVVFGVFWILDRIFRIATAPFRWALGALTRVYPSGLRSALRYRWLWLPLAFALFVVALLAVPRLGTQLVPDLSQGEFAFRMRMPEGSTLESSDSVVARIESSIVNDPNMERMFSVVGSLPSSASGQQTVGENLAQMNFVLSDRGASGDPQDETRSIQAVRRALDRFPDVEAELIRPSVLSMRPAIAVQLFGDDLEELDRGSEQVAAALSRLDGVEDIRTSSQPGNPEITVVLDRERAASYGIRVSDLGRTLQQQIRGEVIGPFREREDRIDIRLRAVENARDRASAVEDLRIRLENGTTVPVAAVADVQFDRGPAAIHRYRGTRVTEVTAQVRQADVGAVLQSVRDAVAEVPLPHTVVAEMGGQDEDLKVSFDSLRMALLLAIFMVYVVMAVQFESFRYPLVILLSVPLGIVGVVAALGITGTPISVLALIGAVMLAGIVVNNAIVLVDAIRRRRQEGEPMDTAIVEAGAERFRPIIMTTTTTVLALLPMALGLGAGDELRRPLALTVIGGLSVATVLTLIVIPCLYRSMSPDASKTEPVAADLRAAPQGEG